MFIFLVMRFSVIVTFCFPSFYSAGIVYGIFIVFVMRINNKGT